MPKEDTRTCVWFVPIVKPLLKYSRNDTMGDCSDCIFNICGFCRIHDYYIQDFGATCDYYDYGR